MTLSDCKRAAIISLLRYGATWDQIIKQEFVSRRTIARISITLRKPGRKKSKRAKVSRPPTPQKRAELQQRRQLVRRLAKQVQRSNGRTIPINASARRIRDSLEREHGIRVSRPTINRDLLRVGMKCFVRPTKTFRLDGDTKQRRLRFAQSFTNMYGRKLSTGSVLYDSVVFSDETIIDTNDFSSRTQRALHKHHCIPRERLNRYNIPFVMLWGAIGVGYKSKLERILNTKDSEGHAKRMNQEKYVRMLSRNGVLAHCKNNDRIFMQDGARCHTARATLGYIERKNVHYISNWPAASPDLNPIENIWALLQQRVALHVDGPARTSDELWERVLDVWKALDQVRDIDPYVRSFQRRLRDVRMGRM